MGTVMLMFVSLAAWATREISASDPSETIRNANEAAEQSGGEPVARVNGIEIPKSALVAVQVSIEGFPVDGLRPDDTAGIVEYLVRQELLRQEATRRGLYPSEDEVTTAIKADQEAFLADLSSGKAPREIVQLIDAHAKAGNPIEGWPTDPEIRMAYRGQMAQAALARDEAKDLPPDRRTPQAVAEKLQELGDRLRDTGNVEILVK
jgi:hypothetical protein